jgi:hypothetical protein
MRPPFAYLGQTAAAIALRQEFATGGPPLPMSLRADPAFTLIRSAPRLQELRPPQAAWAKAQPDPLDL